MHKSEKSYDNFIKYIIDIKENICEYTDCNSNYICEEIVSPKAKKVSINDDNYEDIFPDELFQKIKKKIKEYQYIK